uniref:EIF-4F 25 kDa subunit n=1 Tax=Acrobeloides nanus TaxID=290746 RepID=A0A914DXN6_9BILA
MSCLNKTTPSSSDEAFVLESENDLTNNEAPDTIFEINDDPPVDFDSIVKKSSLAAISKTVLEENGDTQEFSISYQGPTNSTLQNSEIDLIMQMLLEQVDAMNPVYKEEIEKSDFKAFELNGNLEEISLNEMSCQFEKSSTETNQSSSEPSQPASLNDRSSDSMLAESTESNVDMNGFNGFENYDDEPMVDVISGDGYSDDQEEEKELENHVDHSFDVLIPYMNPLKYTWTFWYLKADRSKYWDQRLMRIKDFHTVEEFWSFIDRIHPPSSIPFGNDYYLFKEGIEPNWETCKKGGKWVIYIDNRLRDRLLDAYWLELIMGCIGEQFGCLGEFVGGAVVNRRFKGDKIALWTKDGDNFEVNKKIGKLIKHLLKIPDFEQIYYEVHVDAQKRNSSHYFQKRITLGSSRNF